MTKSPSKKRIVKPPLDRFGGIRVVQRRLKKSEVIEHNKENVAQEQNQQHQRINDTLETSNSMKMTDSIRDTDRKKL